MQGASSELSHKLKLLNLLPVLPGSEVQHTHFLGTLHNKLHDVSVSDLEQDLLDHESAVMRQQDDDILTARMNAVPGVRAPPMFPVSTGTPKLRYPLSRPRLAMALNAASIGMMHLQTSRGDIRIMAPSAAPSS
jgi:hypothetical protein